ncbi:MAG TPA: sulfite exporter TauE/SafE family protein [Actinobacteria bacterium]|nr:sulfite exporter TauE/SafE family protein [Actinomycetota bacterium]
MKRIVGGTALGLVAGFMGGLLGVGGGIILVPGLVLLLGFEQHRAHATSLAAIVASATSASIPFVLDGEVAWDTTGFLLIGSMVGAALGARHIVKISPVWLARGFVAIAFVAAVDLWMSA